MAARKRGLQEIPGVGSSIEKDLQELGYFSVADLKKADPEEMYERSCRIQKLRIDRCLLYVYRCAVKYANMTDKKRENLKWWDFKDKTRR
jgi:hypothetical protein